MPIFISNQAYVFLCSAAGGMLMALIYDFFRIKRKAIRTNNLFIYIEDLVYWIIVALVMFGIVYYSNDGEIRGYIFIGAVLGAVLYILLFSRLVVNSSMFIIGVVYKLIRTVWLILSYPFKLLFRVLRVPAVHLAKACRKLLRKAKRTGKRSVGRAGVWYRIIKNFRKKI